MKVWRTASAVACAPALLVVQVGPALAHGGDPNVVTEISSITPPLPVGAAVEVRTTVSEQMIVSNPTATRLVVLDPDGAPFLRLSRAGAYGNVANPFFHRTLNPPGVPERIPATARAGADPRWLRVSRAGSWGWFEPRLHPFEPGTKSGNGVLATWQVGMRYGSEAMTVLGDVARRPVAGAFLARLDPPPAGLQVSVAQGLVPALLMVAPPDQEVVVLGQDGRDFLRLDKHGVFVSTASTGFRENPIFVSQAAGRRGWVRLGPPGRITWTDPRLSYRSDRPPETVERAERVADLGTWEIPLRVDSEPTALRGSLSWVPAGASVRAGGEGSGPSRLALGIGSVFAAALLGVALQARRRSRGLGPRPSSG